MQQHNLSHRLKSPYSMSISDKLPSTRSQELENLLVQAEELLCLGEPESCLALCLEGLQIEPSDPDLLFLQALSMQLIGSWEEALSILYSIVTTDSQNLQAWAHIAILQLELMDLKAAKAVIKTIQDKDATFEDGWWLRSILRERMNDIEGADRAYGMANWLDPSEYPMLPYFDDHELRELISEVLNTAPPFLKMLYQQSIVQFKETPGTEHIELSDLPPLQILCTPIPKTGFIRPIHQPTLVIFKRNIRRALVDKELLVQRLLNDFETHLLSGNTSGIEA
ncbi:MAG: hypothetical protein CMK59_12995 [Proteobacteria bacterium]|nr:hypothetical protein [Pseudomonadota bacterium]